MKSSASELGLSVFNLIFDFYELSEGKLRMRYSFLVYQAIDVIPKEWFSIARRHDTADAEDYGRNLTRYSVQESKQKARMSWYRFEYHPGI